MRQERRIWWHWQNLSPERHGKQGSGIIHGRAWLNVFAWKFHCEWHLWSRACHLSLDFGGNWSDDDMLFGFAFPPISFYFGFEAPWGGWVKKLFPSEPRSCGVSINHWGLRIDPWTNPLEWKGADPWWRKGKTFDFKDIVLGRTNYTTEEIKPQQRIEVELDGRKYLGTAKFERSTWKRPRWFPLVRESTWITMDQSHGLPHAGKGENSWDCGDDAICGWGVEGINVPKAIGSGIERVLERRKRYGTASFLREDKVA